MPQQYVYNGADKNLPDIPAGYVNAGCPLTKRDPRLTSATTANGFSLSKAGRTRTHTSMRCPGGSNEESGACSEGKVGMISVR